jgi:hypothetical protein
MQYSKFRRILQKMKFKFYPQPRYPHGRCGIRSDTGYPYADGNVVADPTSSMGENDSHSGGMTVKTKTHTCKATISNNLCGPTRMMTLSDVSL